MLTLSPTLVGGVEDSDCAFERMSAVVVLGNESEDDARARRSFRVEARGLDAEPMRSRSVENMLKGDVALCCEHKLGVGLAMK